MEPTAALDRAIYLLDRELAPSTKIRAFQRAKEIVSELAPDELRTRATNGTLTELDGIGKSTGAVVTEALTGVDDGYLTDLEDRSQIPLGVGGDLRDAIRGDCHMHSDWSDGGAPLETMVRTAKGLGHDYVVATDHSARLTVAHGLSEERLVWQLDEVEKLNAELAPFRVLSGMEVDIFEDGSLDLADDMLARLDVVVASVHSKLRMPAPDMTRRLVTAVANPHVDILGHMTNRKVSGTGRPPSEFDAEIVFAACAKFDTAVEINCRPERQDPPEELLELAVEWDCYIAIDTDAHAPGQLEWQAYGCDKAVRCGVDPARIINTWSAEELVDWTATK
ncbi:MAG: PHP domain-containing protein [Acidimicrobiia bacterium]|nr:PHP domain-containing protein [Acidimicrobiia bacterium]